MKKFLFSMAWVSLLFGSDYDVGLDAYKNKEYKQAYEYPESFIVLNFQPFYF